MKATSIALALLLALTLTGGATIVAADAPDGPDVPTWEVTPPRVSYVSGEASFWRPGSEGWTPAQVNIPLAPGDALAVGADGTVEVQVGPRAFVRAAGGARLGLEIQEPDFLRFTATAGHVALDVRDLPPGHTLTLNTPRATLTVERPGYYRMSLSPDTTTVAAYRGGQAVVAPITGPPVAVVTGQQLILTGADEPTLASAAAPELSAWDRWNYQRTDSLVAYTSARYVAPDVYGAEALDRYGSWQVVETYGPVWLPAAVPSSWAPYTAGRWLWDPRYGWTWLDEAPWGWAPFHYGRWVFVNGAWGWAPGPVLARPVYVPALVAFLDSPVIIERPVCWVALGWGEPVTPWWGRRGFAGKPWWGGWGGPRVVNNVVINRTTVVDVEHITVYRNVGARNAVVAVPAQRFAQDPVAKARIAHVDVAGLRPRHGPPPGKPVLASGEPADARGGNSRETVPKRREPASSQRPADWPGVSSDHDAPRDRALPLPPDGAKRGRAAAPPRPAPRLTEDSGRDQAPPEVNRKPRGHDPDQEAGIAPDRPAADAPRVRKRDLSTPPAAVKQDRSLVPPLSMPPDASRVNGGHQRPDASPVVGGPAREKPDRGDGPNAVKRGKAPDPPGVDRRGPAMTAPRPADLTGGPPVGSREQMSTRPERPTGPGSAREPKVTRHSAPSTPTPVPLTREVKPRAGRPEPTGYMPPPAKPSPAVNRGKDPAEGPRKGPGPKSPKAEPPSR